MKHLDPITTIFETDDNGGIKITHILSKSSSKYRYKSTQSP